MPGAGAVIQARTRRTTPPWVAWVVVLMVVLAVWLGLGSLRATTIARDAFAVAHGPGATVANVQIEGSGPAIPPFWSVTISGDVIEAGRTDPAYRSHMILWVEPITGSVFVGGSG
jgi:hypothetical protein